MAMQRFVRRAPSAVSTRTTSLRLPQKKTMRRIPIDMRLPKSVHHGVGSSWTQSFTESHVQVPQLGHLIGPVGLFEKAKGPETVIERRSLNQHPA